MKETILPETLLRIRAANDLNQKDLADKMGVSVSTVSNWERGDYPVPPVKAEKFRLLWPEETA